MAGSLNKVQLIGNVGADPEIRSVGDGRVANLRIATSETWRDKNSGERREKTEWHSVAVWNVVLVGVIEKYVSKGSKLYVEGQLQTRKWQDQSGNDRYSTEVVLTGLNGKVILLGDPGGNSRNNDNASQSQRNSYSEQSGGSYAALDDEIPF